MKHRICLFPGLLLLLSFQAVNASDISNPGTYDRTVMSPWNYVDVHWSEFKDQEYVTWATNDKDCIIRETDYCCTSGKKGFGYTVERADGKDKYRPHFMAYYQYSRQVPPYAVFKAEWDWYLCHEGDKGKSLAYFSIYNNKDTAESRNLYVYAEGDASDSDKQNHRFVVKSSYKDHKDSYESWEDGMTGTYVMSFDNSSSGKSAVYSLYLMHVACFYAKSDDGHVKSTIGTDDFRPSVYYPRFDGSGTAQSPLKIASGADLKAFADIVNTGIDGTDALHAVLVNDIDYTSYKDVSAMIGSPEHPYQGVFDGQGYSIRTAFSLESDDNTGAGLFRCVKGASIKNLMLSGTLSGYNYMGSVVGAAQDAVLIENVISSVSITSSKSGEMYVGGLVSEINDGNSSQITFKNCGFRGSLLAANGGNSAGGFLGWVQPNSKAEFVNCYFAPTEVTADSTSSCTFARAFYTENVITENCYYTYQLGEAQGEKVTDAQMRSGELCYLLNGSVNNGEPWRQTIGTDNAPTLWNALPVSKRGNEFYNYQPPFRGSGTEQDPFQIGTVQELEHFRDIVNSGYPTICAKVVADLDLADRNWVPIGHDITEYAVPYRGVFDGNGYIISNLSSSIEEEMFVGLFGTVVNATIRNVLLKNVTVKAKAHAGTVSGRADGSLIENCGVFGIVSVGGRSNSGIACCNGAKTTVRSCYTVFSGKISAGDQIVSEHIYSGTDVENMHASGELTYKLNDGSLSPWKQNIGRDGYPLLRGALSVYYDNNTKTYYNDTYQGGDEAGFLENISGKDFRVFHHGGRLYEFVITVATQDGAGVSTCPDASVSYSENGEWKSILTLSDINADTLDFGQDWWGKISIEQGMVYDPLTYDTQVPTFWARQGNHTTCKQTSLLWVAPEELPSMPGRFMIRGTEQGSKFSITSETEDTEEPDDGSGLSVVDPFIATTKDEAGSLMTMIASACKSYSLGLWDATDSRFISMQETPDGVTSSEAYMPQQERCHDIVALTTAMSVDMDKYGRSDTTLTNYAFRLRQKPAHSILRTNVSQDYSAVNRLDWAIAFPNDTDILDADQFIVARGYSPDWSDVSTVASFNLQDFKSTTTENDTLFGWFSYQDTTAIDRSALIVTSDTVTAFDTWNIPASAKEALGVYRYPARYLYYQSYRTMVTAIWNSHDKYVARWKVLQKEVLPTVDSVRIIKDADFENNHKVTVRVVLGNPYPWEVVSGDDRDIVMQEARRQLFEQRMFCWDEDASITLQRFSTADEYDGGKDAIAKTVTIPGSSIRLDNVAGVYYVEYQDVASVPFVHYYYQAKVDDSKSTYPICESRNVYVISKEQCYSEKFGVVSNLKATLGTMKGAVGLTWESDDCNGTSITLQRREYERGYTSEKPLAGWSEMAAGTNSAIDEKASAAVVNEYILTVTTRYRDQVYTQSDTAYGYAAYYGTLSGRVKMPNGVNMPGEVQVNVACDEPFALHQVSHPGTSEVILPEFHAGSVSFELTTDENGAYTADSLPYYGTGRQYTVQATCFGGAKFTGPTGTSSSVSLVYEDGCHEYSDVDFTCNDTRRFSGRILYTNSTVPVRGVSFLVNGTQLKDANGEPVVTDAMGNFSFIVPVMRDSIKAFKEGHQLTDGGYILGGDDGQQRAFTPSHDYDGLVIYDDTKLRLVGRVTGGNQQDVLPLGFGLGHNNLGDSITLVLTLEGDHTSYLYYDKKNPDNKSCRSSFTQLVTDTHNDYRIPTEVSFESKRIVVRADNKTGEFCLDLYPARYVLTQIYANGYSTLYSAGEGSAVIDLTDSVGVQTHYNGTEHTSYDASYRKVYHAPAEVDILQLRNNSYQAIYGEEALEVEILSGKQQIQLSWMDSTSSACYSFGHPVFEGGGQYFFQVQAFEPYYYNNVITGSYERVPMAGSKVSVSSGLSLDDSNVGDLVLSESGTAVFCITTDNTTFTMTDENALRYLSAAVEINGSHYESERIAGYVTGERDYSVEVMSALEGSPQILDYIRDPYGAESYSYRSSGTNYKWSRSYEKTRKESCQFSLEIGMAFISTKGAMMAKTSQYDVSVSGGLNAVTKNEIEYKNGEFSLTLGDRISTSSDPEEQGAAADVYIGTVSTADVVKYQTFNVVDNLTYQSLKPAVESGAAKVVAGGLNEKGEPCYIVICGGVTWQPGKERFFAYSQQYITNILIPNLEARKAEALRLAPSIDDAILMASQSGRTIYYRNRDGEYVPVYPSTFTVQKDTVEMLSDRIREWEEVIAENERIKYEAMTEEADMNYSIAGTSIEHTEDASTYYRVRNVNGPTPTTGTFSAGTSGGSPSTDSSGTGLLGYGLKFSLSIGGGVEEKSSSNTMDNYTVMTGGSGFIISPKDNSYFDIDVHYENDASILTVDSDFKSDVNKYESGSGLDDYKLTSNDRQKMTDDNTYVHNYIFVMRGGATRNPWIDADSTLYYRPDGENRVPLGVRTLRIDNPRIYVEQPVVYNQPQDEKAVFTLHLSNESELTGSVRDVASTLCLSVVESSNPHGARLSIDGQPLTGKIQFAINPGESVVKTLEVERGGKPYDYENIRLQLSDNIQALSDEVTLSVHYLPVSSPVTLTQPAQNFLINTLSQVDEDGKYYIPVQIEGFSTVKYDNFDHIELQYKRQTDGEDQWVNLCSYFADDSLYRISSGTKEMIATDSKISNIRFYGETDPVEMKYDLRAVSFCRLGNGYVTRQSEVVSGTKDTRCPDVFGMPKPVDGILDFDDVISLPFTEPIAYNYLDETANFSVQGYTNSSDADNSVSLYFSGADNQSAQSAVTRVLNNMDFTVEMNVQPDPDVSEDMSLLSIADEYGNADEGIFAFAYLPDEDCLAACMGNDIVTSESIEAACGIDLSSQMTHVGMTYEASDSTVRFFVGEQWVQVSPDCMGKKYATKANGVVKLGYKYTGYMGNIRLWSKVLDTYEMSSRYGQRLSANESNLLAYWPATEASGTTLYDAANGADIILKNVSWKLADGFSVSLDHQTMSILSDQSLKFTRDRGEDFTLSFWFKVSQADGDADIFAAGSDALEETGMDKVRIRFVNGVLYYISEGESHAFGTGNDFLSDAAWHYLAVSVSHSHNKLALFIDGQMVNEAKAENVGGMTGSAISFGSTAMNANIDQIEVWGMALPASYIKSYYNTALIGTEKELLVYMNFEQDEENSQGTMSVSFSPCNQVITSAGTIAGDRMVDVPESQQDGKEAAPVHSSAGIQNLPFKWKSSDNELQITLDETLPSDINKQQVNIVVRNVEDVNGNPMKNAQMWSAYVNYNVLSWEADSRTAVLQYGRDTTLTAIFENASGKNLSYTLDCSCPYISLSKTMGTIGPLSMDAVAVEVGDGLAPGVYSAAINLIDENNLCSTLTIDILVKAAEPDWQVTADSSYNQTMKLAGVVMKQTSNGWAVDMCRKDVVAAFIGKTCVGKASLTIDATENTSSVFLTVRGNEGLQGREVEFRLFDALKGEISLLETGAEDLQGNWTAEPVCFVSNAITGTDEPVEMRTTSMKEQSLALNPGWNWISLNVKPLSQKGLGNLFRDESAFVPEDMFKHLYEGFAYFQSDRTWEASLDGMDFERENVYQVYSKTGGTVTVDGIEYEESERYAVLDFSYSEWAEMAYLSDQAQPIDVALSDFVPGTAKAPAGTVINGYDAFAVARADGKWFGSLEYLRPGEGYYVRRNGLTENVQIHFSNTTKSAVPAVYRALAGPAVSASSSMPVIAAFSDDFQTGDVLLAVVNGTVAGRAEAMILDGQSVRYMVSVHGNDGDKVTFVKERNGEIVAASARSVRFDGRSVLGTLDSPYLIDFEETAMEGIYDVMGLRYNGQDNLSTDRVFIIGDRKVINR